MDIFAQARLKYKQKKKIERGGSAGLDLRSLKLFVDDAEASDSSDHKITGIKFDLRNELN